MGSWYKCHFKNTFKNWFLVVASLLAAYIAFVSLSLLRYYTSVSVQASYEPLMSLAPQLAKHRSHVDSSAYVFLALGAQSNSMTCPGAIESLVRYSGWSGDVFLLTDRPSCFDQDQIVANAEMDPSRLHIVTVDGDFASGGYDPADEVQFRKARLMSLTMKTRIFELIPNKEIKILAFIDCDIIVGVEGCATKFIDGGPKFGEKDYNVIFSRMYYEDHDGVVSMQKTQGEQVAKGYTFHDVHSGTFVVHRDYSEKLLELWRKEMESFEHVCNLCAQYMSFICNLYVMYLTIFLVATGWRS